MWRAIMKARVAHRQNSYVNALPPALQTVSVLIDRAFQEVIE
jgi:hypothetical protein